MGELKTRRLTVSLSDELREKLDELVPEGSRSAFVSEALELALRKKAREKSLAYFKALERTEPDPPGSRSEDYIRELRAQAERFEET